MNAITRIAAPLAIALFTIGAQAQEVAPGDIGIHSTSSGSRAAATVAAPAGARSGDVAAGDLNLQPVSSGSRATASAVALIGARSGDVAAGDLNLQPVGMRDGTAFEIPAVATSPTQPLSVF